LRITTVKVRPSISHVVPIVFKEIFLPTLPSGIQKFLDRSTPPWPGKLIGERLEDTPWKLSPTRRISAKEVNQLKILGKSLGVKTLHPIFHGLYLTALWAIVHHTERLKEFGQTTATSRNLPFKVGSGTSINERDSKGKGHAFCTGVYICQLEDEAILTSKVRFWDIVRNYATSLMGEKGRRRARGTVGLLKHIPKVIVKEGLTTHTGWEVYLRDKAGSDTPVRISLVISNLGNVDTGMGGARFSCGPAMRRYRRYTVDAVSQPILNTYRGECDWVWRQYVLEYYLPRYERGDL